MIKVTKMGLSALDAYAKVWNERANENTAGIDLEHYMLAIPLDAADAISEQDAEDFLQKFERQHKTSGARLVVFTKEKIKDVNVAILEHFIDTPEEKVHITESTESDHHAAFALFLATGNKDNPDMPFLNRHTRKFDRAIKDTITAVQKHKIPLVVRDSETKQPCYTVTPIILDTANEALQTAPLYSYTFFFDND